MMAPTDMHQKIQDSLDNISYKNKAKDEQNRKLNAQIKQNFISSLQKLQSSETRERGIREIRNIIERYRDPTFLRIYIAVLKNLKPNAQSATKEHQVLVISLLAELFQRNLLDPIDKSPSIVKTGFRLIEILHSYFADTSSTVQQACARALMDLNRYCLQTQGIENIYCLIFEPLSSILRNGVDKASQATAAVCLNEFIQYWYQNHNNEMLQRISKDMFQIILKLNCEYHEIFMAISTMIETIGLKIFENKLIQFINKILGVIHSTRESNFNNYMCKVNACKIIQKIACILSESQKNQLLDLNVLNSLEKASRNKIIQVQMAAHRAIKVWKGQLQPEKQIGKQNTHKLKSLEELRNNMKIQRSRSKEQKTRIEKQLGSMKSDLNKMVKGGWGASNRAKNYVKRGTGVGGGYHGKLDSSPSPTNNNKSHKQHIQELRDFIKNSTKQNQHINKYQTEVRIVQNKNKLQNNNHYKNKNNQNMDFTYQENKGDQGINLRNNRSKSSKMVAPKFTAIEGMQDEEVKQLLMEENQLMQHAIDMSIDFKQSNKSQKKISIEQKKQKKIQKYYQDLVKPSIQDKNKNVSQQQKININQSSLQKYKVLFTPQELNEFIEVQNFSQVSQCLEGVINESDMFDEGDSVKNIHILADQHNKKDQMEIIKDIIDQKRNKKSIASSVNKFMKKSRKLDEGQEDIAQSLNYTESNNSKFIINKKKFQKPQEFERMNQKEVIQDNFSNNPPQFTLNPFTIQKVEKFSIIKKESLQKQIEQDLAISGYEESISKEQKKQNKSIIKIQKQIIKKQQKQNRQEQQYKIGQSEIFQNIIRNPPKNYQMSQFKDQKSKIVCPISEKKQQQEQKTEAVSQYWQQILVHLQQNQINQAYNKAYQMGNYVFIVDDPIYLLRLIVLTKNPFKHLTAENATKLWEKFLQIYKHEFIDVLFIRIFTEAEDLKILKSCLTAEELQEMMLQLFEVSGVSKGKISYNSASLYNKIDQQLHQNQ